MSKLTKNEQRELSAWIGAEAYERLEALDLPGIEMLRIHTAASLAVRTGYDIGYEAAERVNR